MYNFSPKPADAQGARITMALAKLVGAIQFAFCTRFAGNELGPALAAPCGLTFPQMLDGIRAAAGDGSISPASVDEICDELHQILSLVTAFPALCGLVPVPDFDGLPLQVLSGRDAFYGLAMEDIVRQLPWQLERLACAIYSLPIRVH